MMVGAVAGPGAQYARRDDVGAADVVMGKRTTFYYMKAVNSIASARFIQVFDAPRTGDFTLGTTAPAWEGQVAASGEVEWNPGLVFASGIVIACTTAHKGGTTSAAGVLVTIGYGM